jgi:hypothetical protein
MGSLMPFDLSAPEIIAALITSTLGGTLGTTIVGLFFLKRQNEMRWMEQSVTELLGPMAMQFSRSNKAMERWKEEDRYLETKVVREANHTNLEILLAKGHLIPPDLMESATQLITHYDVWLQKYEQVYSVSDEKKREKFVFVGPDGYPFPKDAEKRFFDKLRDFRSKVYGIKTTTGA